MLPSPAMHATPAGLRLPDFIIGGAMKSGTTSLHHLLGALPGVFVPDPEIFYFDIDDFEQHPDFFAGPGGTWRVPDWERHADEYLAWYTSFFAPAPAGALVGEDSTTYLASRKAPSRIRELLGDVRLIFMLRDPAERAYSHYWHLVRTGRATRRFESTIRHHPGTLIQRGLYREQARRYLDLFERDRLLFLLFEDFVSDPLAALRHAARFLGRAEPEALPTAPHRNPARVPRNLTLQLLRNRILGHRSSARFEGHLPGTARRHSAVEAAMRSRLPPVNLRRARPPAMAPGTRRALNELFAMENRGLGDLLGIDVEKRWYQRP
jgi:hypothetical protein